MSAREVMVTDVVTAHPDETAGAVALRMLEHDLAAIPVVDDEGHILGVVSDVELIRLVVPAYMDLLEDTDFLPDDFEPFERRATTAGATLVRDIMSDQFETVSEDTSLPSVAAHLVRPGVRRVFVVRDGRLVGAVGRRDVFTTMFDRAHAQSGVDHGDLL